MDENITGLATEVRMIIADVGIEGLLIVLMIVMIGAAVWWNWKYGTRSAGEVVVDAVVPDLTAKTCQWSDKDRSDIAKLVDAVSDIRGDVKMIRTEVHDIEVTVSLQDKIIGILKDRSDREDRQR